MTNFKNISLNVLFALQVLLVFLLLFDSHLTVPRWLQPVGRMHPLLLHLPIGFLLLAALLPFLRKHIDQLAYQKTQQYVLTLAALGAALTAIMGLFLSREPGYTSSLLDWHKWFGVGVSILAYFLVLVAQHRPQQHTLMHGLLGVTVVSVILAGHFGAGITHGEDFLWAPLQDDQVVITEDTSLYTAAIVPVLESKCYGCHNARKAKGELIMTDRASLLTGGENGPIWVAGEPDSSQLIQRVRLPLEHDDHMPPEGKPQLTDTEILLLSSWIASGADLYQPLKNYTGADTLQVLARSAYEQQPKAVAKKYPFKAAADETIAALNTPFRSVQPVSLHAPALEAQIFVRATYEQRMLEELQEVKDQLIHLNLTNLPITDADIATIAGFPNLEKLVLNGTDITGATLDQLKACNKLTSLALASTSVGEGIEEKLNQLPALQEVFIWNTPLMENDIAQLETHLAPVRLVKGYVPDENEVLQLGPPILKNSNAVLVEDEPIALRHTFPGAEIRYTIDGSEPDSLQSPVYTEPFLLDGYTELKAKAYKPGWLTSESVQFTFFQTGKLPTRAELVHPPNRDYLGDGARGLFDNKKGFADNFKSVEWLGYKNKPFAAYFYFGEKPPSIRKVVLSYAVNMGSYIMPPVKVEVWAGADPDNLQRLATKTPTFPDEYGPNQVVGLQLDIPESAYPCVMVRATPIQKLPEWHAGKGSRGWVFVDEVFFY